MPVPTDERERTPAALLAAALLFNLGQGVLRPSMPLYLQRAFGANYRMVTLIPVVFGLGKWAASLPTGAALRHHGRALMVCGLLLIALIDVGSVSTSTYPLFLALRALGGVGWAMFATVATTVMVDRSAGRGRTVSRLMMAETAGLLAGTAAGGWLYQGFGGPSPFLFEAACMLLAAAVVARWTRAADGPSTVSSTPPTGRRLFAVVRTPGVMTASLTNALLIGLHTGVLVFLFPLFVVSRTEAAPATVGVIVSLGVVGRLVALWLGGALSDRWGRTRVLVPALAVYGLLLGGITLSGDIISLGVLSFGIGTMAGLLAPIPTAVVGDLASPAQRGVAIGWLRTVTDAGHILGPLVMGAVADAGGLSAPFLMGAALLIAAAWPGHRAGPRSR